MNITYLFGNGFDVNLGLATKYTDYYPIYLKTIQNILENDDLSSMSIKDRNIKKFWSNITKSYENWADFEEAIAILAKGDENDIKHILSDFTAKFYAYMIEIQNSAECPIQIIDDFVDFILNGQNNLQRHDKQILDSYKIGAKLESDIINIITFNYTNSVEKILENLKGKYENNIIFSKKGTPYTAKISTPILHIHGTLDDDDSVIIGIDSVDQFEDENLKHNTSVSQYCVKTQINTDIGFLFREERFKKIIMSSQIVYTYGIAFGKTDKSRWKVLAEWLQKDTAHKLVVYYYDTKFSTIKSAYARDLLDHIDNLKKDIIQKIELDLNKFHEYKDQIFIIDSGAVLKTKFIIKEIATT